MTNTFTPTLRNPLYCVWIKTGEPSEPLQLVWMLSGNS